METYASVHRLKSALSLAGIFCFYLYGLLLLTLIPFLGMVLNAVLFFSPFVLILKALSFDSHQIESSHLSLAIFVPYPVIGFVWGFTRPAPVSLSWQMFRMGFIRFLLVFAVLAVFGFVAALLVAANDS